MTPLLTVEHLQVRYGAIVALHEVSFRVDVGQIVTLIGANGAGKSTTLNALSGLVRAQGGRVIFDGKSLLAANTHVSRDNGSYQETSPRFFLHQLASSGMQWRADRISRAGLVQVPEGRQIIAPMTVEDNLRMGAYKRRNPIAVNRDIEEIFERFPRLRERRLQKAGLLSGGEQQMLAVGRALMMRPRLLMLDEPSMGLAPLLVAEVFALIKRINEQGTTILLVEQNARKALQIAHYAYVMERGRIIQHGPAATLQTDEALIAAYLG